MRSDEQFVAEAVAQEFGGSWRPGPDPPDFILSLKDEEVAVEVSTFAEQVRSGPNWLEPRHSVDSAAVALCERLNSSLLSDIPNQMTVIVILKTPLDNFSKCETRIRNAIQAGAKKVADREEEIELLGNKIRIHYSLVPRSSDKKVVGIVDNQRASADIYENVRVALEHRLVEKTKSCQSLPYRSLWLALLHDYWLAPESTVAQAMKASSVVQPFEKILLVLGSGRVCSIFERT